MLRRLLVGLLGLALVAVAGWWLPRLLVDDGVARFSGEEGVVAAEALRSARGGCSNRVGWPLVVPALQVRRVELLPGSLPAEPTLPQVPRYRAEVRELTLFGIPIGTIQVSGLTQKQRGYPSCPF